MKKKAGRIFLTAGTVLLLLFGCRRTESAADVLRDAVENSNKAESFSGNVDLDMGIGIEESGISLGMDLNMDLDIEAVKDSGAYHMKGDVKASLIDILEGIEIYGIPDDDGSDFLNYVGFDKSWTKMKSPSEEKGNIGSLMDLENYIDSGSKLEMEESGKENGREVYVISTTAKNMELKSAGSILDNLLGDDGISIGFNDVTSKVIFKIYKDNRYPASVSVTLSGKDGEPFAVSDENDGTFTIKHMDFTLVFEEFDNVKEIKVPEEALEARADSFDIMGDLEKEDSDEDEEPELRKDKDGNYILTDWDNGMEVSIPKPEGMSVDQYSDDTSLCFYMEGDKPYSATYTLEILYEPSDEQLYIDMATGMKSTYEATSGYSDVRYQEEKEIQSGKRTVKYVGLSFTYEEDTYSNAVWAWTIIDDEYMLLCEIREYPESKEDYAINDDVIRILFEGI